MLSPGPRRDDAGRPSGGSATTCECDARGARQSDRARNLITLQELVDAPIHKRRVNARRPKAAGAAPCVLSVGTPDPRTPGPQECGSVPGDVQRGWPLQIESFKDRHVSQDPERSVLSNNPPRDNGWIGCRAAKTKHKELTMKAIRQGRTRMIVFPGRRSVGLKAATASSRVATGSRLCGKPAQRGRGYLVGGGSRRFAVRGRLFARRSR